MLDSRVSRSRSRVVNRHGKGLPKSAAPNYSGQTYAQNEAFGAGRPITLLAIIILAAGALTSRLVFWQVMQHGHLATVATQEREALLAQPPLRGQITDSHGSPLAADVTLDQVYAVPKEMKDPEGTASALAPILGEDAAALERRFAEFPGYVLIAQHVAAPVSTRIKRLQLAGIVLRPTMSRYYPEGSAASQVVGFVNGDNKGNYGLEQYYDRVLSGTTGRGSALRDTAGNSIRLGNGPDKMPQDGMSLQLSLDGAIQSLAENELKKAVKQHHADSGSVLVIDPNTGFVLAMANTPTYDSNRYSRVTDGSLYRNPSVEGTYEPGSTFKIVTMAAGLDSHVITPDSMLDDTGTFRIADATIHNWCDCGFGMENMTQVLQHSANVGAAWVALHMSTGQFYSYLTRFGFGSRTNVDLADEQSGQLPLPGSRSWTIVSKYTNAYGQGLAVTPIQLLRAVGAVANGGLLVKPQLVQRMTYGSHAFETRPAVQKRVISSATAHTLTSMLVKSAVGGEAEKALVKGYDVAAKTGTANIAGPNGKYIQGATIASIVGYAPAYNPKFAALVIINHPRDTQWGSLAAAPVMHNLFQELFLYYHIPPMHQIAN